LAGEIQWKSLRNAISSALAGCKALVLDLRGGVGGASPEFADYFVGQSPELRLTSARIPGETVVNPRWRKPLVVLADESTRSGTEVLVFAMKQAGVPIVGSRTAGAVAAAKPFLLSDRSLLLVAVKFATVNGVTLEGHGVEPTIHVPREIPYSAGMDQPLEEAQKIAASLA
jgi:carboxyl-terminal processing protease